MMTPRQSTKITLLAMCACTTLTLFPIQAKAGTIWIDCKPYRVAVKSDLIHTQCEGDNNWYGVKYTSANTEFVNRVLSILNASVLAGKSGKLAVEKTQQGWRDIVGVEMFK